MSKLFSISKVPGILCNSIYIQTAFANTGNVRYLKRHVRPVMKELYRRRIAAGPEPERPRSAWINWNYRAEIFAFGKRLGENFEEDTLKKAFVQTSYIDLERDRRQSLGIEDSEISLEDNTKLAHMGHQITSDYIRKYMKHIYPKLPNSLIIDIENYLTSKEMLTYISSNLGTKDLILSEEFPPSDDSLVKTLMAVIGALKTDQGLKRAEQFVLDFIITQLKGKELSELLNIVNPMGLLTNILHDLGREGPEPRLLWKTGSSTVTSAYVVGIYCNKELIGQSPGETLIIAEEMAARDALCRYFDIRDNCDRLKYGEEGYKLNLAQ